ncbi:hypothetical protein C0992_001586, partial [Termitomyces sp. T32_za158]
GASIAGVHLGEYAGDGVVGGIAFEHNGEFRIEVPQDRGSSEGFFEEFEDALALTVPVPCNLLPGEASQGFRDAGVVVDESPVEIGKA